MSVARLSAVASAAPVARPRPPSLSEYVDETGLQSVVVGVSKDPNAKLTVLLVDPARGRPVIAVKVPTTDAAARAIARERGLLVGLHELLPPPLARTVPRVVGAVEFEGRIGLVATAVEGTPMTVSFLARRHTTSPRKVAADFAAVGDWLSTFQEATASGSGPVDLVERTVARLRVRFPGDERLERALGRLAEVGDRLHAETVPRVAAHGDLWFGNVLLDDRGVSGVVDWEAGALARDGVGDVARFAVVHALYLDRRTKRRRALGPDAPGFGAAFELALAGRGWFPDLFRGFLENGLARLGAAPQRWRDAALAGVAEIAALTDDDCFARSNLELFLRLVERPTRKELR